MTQPINLNNIDVNSFSTTKNFFNNTFLPSVTVSQNINDSILAYFTQVAETKEAARALAASVILTSVSQGLNPMETLQEFSKMDRGQLNDYLTMFLNLNRVGTSFLGINNNPTPSKYITRMIRA